MHPRNPYDKPIDFVALSCGYLPLKAFLNPKTRMIDFQDARAQRALTKAILKTDFSLELEVPEDRLCPPVPNRLNYVLWVEDIVKAMCQGLRLVKASPSSSGDIALDEAQLGVHGLDIGTGSSAIYPLLACVRNPSWSILATELDEQSFTYAERNIHTNDFSSRITLHRASSYLFGPLFADPSLRISFTMCNPPFYASVSEISASKAAKDEDALSTCTGGDREMVYAPSPTTLPARPPPPAKRSEEYETAYAKAIREGGEIAFLARMVDESLYLGERGGWYTSMLGKMRSVPDVVGLIKLAGIDNYAITQFTQGQTRRWAVGWSFSSLRLPDDVSRMSYLPPTHALYKVQPSRTTLDRPIAYPRTLAPTTSTPQEALASIERLNDREVGEDEGEEEEETWVVRAKENTWSRAARRKRK
ncbi:S-adenosyl-L-methionine dependent methyltransferase, partial [Ephemerocybe angulata]